MTRVKDVFPKETKRTYSVSVDSDLGIELKRDFVGLQDYRRQLNDTHNACLVQSSRHKLLCTVRVVELILNCFVDEAKLATVMFFWLTGLFWTL